MHNHQPHNIRFTIIFFLFCLSFLGIVANLYRIQILQYHFFEQLAQEQYQSIITIPTSRAPIFDRTGTQFLALNKECISAFMVPATCKESVRVQSFLRAHFPAALERLNQHPHSPFMYIKRRLSYEEKNLIEQANIPEIQLINEESRYYPVSAAAAVCGITDIDNKGLFGIELQCDERLAGKPTTVVLEKDARSGLSYFKKNTSIAGTDGLPVTLTIDGTLQFLAREELLETLSTYTSDEGAVLVLDPATGDIISMVTIPDFDPNDTQQIDLAATKNRIVTERYELGSVIKVCAALAAFEEGVVEPDEIIDCKGAKTAWVDGRKINTVHAHGAIPFWEVIAQSNNIGTAIVAKRVGTKLYDHYITMGFGEKTGIGFPGEQQGYVNHPDNWSKQSIISLSYGYEVSITLLHLAQFFAMIANDGIMVHPRLILDPPGFQKEASKKPLFSEKSIATMKMILEKTTLQGTARKAAIKGYRIMSKTGTANTLVNGKYSEDENLFTCAGIVEKDNYKRVIVVFVRAPGASHRHAASVAVPLFERVTEKVLIHDKII
jgi:cell division protein FtsI (penicillin-binding protein 3)